MDLGSEMLLDRIEIKTLPESCYLSFLAVNASFTKWLLNGLFLARLVYSCVFDEILVPAFWLECQKNSLNLLQDLLQPQNIVF